MVVGGGGTVVSGRGVGWGGGLRRTGEACPALADPTEASLHLRQQLVHDRVPPRPLARAVHRVGIVVVRRRVLDLAARYGIIAPVLFEP